MKFLYDLGMNIYLDRYTDSADYEGPADLRLESYLWHVLGAFEVLRVREIISKELKENEIN